MIKVHVGSQDFGYSVAIYVTDEVNGTRLLLHFGDEGLTTYDEVPGTGCTVKPSFTLEDSAARALLDGLTRFYHGAEDTRALREDYDAERARVDKLTNALIENQQTIIRGASGATAR